MINTGLQVRADRDVAWKSLHWLLSAGRLCEAAGQSIRADRLIIVWTGMLLAVWTGIALATGSVADIVDGVQPKVVKIHGAGGVRGLEAYQSGFLISDKGHVLTAWSYVLDADEVSVTLDDGRRFVGEMVGMDPRLEIAILKIDATDLPHFQLDAAVSLTVGDRVLAFCNVYGVATGDEPLSVLHGVVSATSGLSGRRGRFRTPYSGPIYVVDAMTNNAGAAGGVLTDGQGRIAGVLGKEIRDDGSNVWLNYAIPAAETAAAVADILAGKIRPRVVDDERPRAKRPWSLQVMGIQLVPDLLPRTPPFVHIVLPSTPAQNVSLEPDDLLLYIDGVMVRSVKDVIAELSFRDRDETVILSVLRDQELITVEIETR